MRNHFHFITLSARRRRNAEAYARRNGSYHVTLITNTTELDHCLRVVIEGFFKLANNMVEHISRYIHLNRKQWQTTPTVASGTIYLVKKAEWVHPDAVLAMFNNDRKNTKKFLADYVITKGQA